MTINSKTTLIAILSIAALSIAIASVQSIMTAQQPIKTLPASPQGEWVALTMANGNQVDREKMDTADARHRRLEETGAHRNFRPYEEELVNSVMLYHTGTGKVRHVTWPDDRSPDAANMIVIESR